MVYRSIAGVTTYLIVANGTPLGYIAMEKPAEARGFLEKYLELKLQVAPELVHMLPEPLVAAQVQDVVYVALPMNNLWDELQGMTAKVWLKEIEGKRMIEEKQPHIIYLASHKQAFGTRLPFGKDDPKPCEEAIWDSWITETGTAWNWRVHLSSSELPAFLAKYNATLEPYGNIRINDI